jgi:hypothetical protein
VQYSFDKFQHRLRQRVVAVERALLREAQEEAEDSHFDGLAADGYGDDGYGGGDGYGDGGGDGGGGGAAPVLPLPPRVAGAAVLSRGEFVASVRARRLQRARTHRAQLWAASIRHFVHSLHAYISEQSASAAWAGFEAELEQAADAGGAADPVEAERVYGVAGLRHLHALRLRTMLERCFLLRRAPHTTVHKLLMKMLEMAR